jgi:hypothetical protein
VSTIDYFEDDQQDAEKPAPTIERLVGLAAEAKDLEGQLLADQAALAEKQDKLDKILRERIPDIMEELGLEDFKMSDGAKISVKEDVKCSISEERKPEAFGWLRAHDYDGIIKTAVAVNFGKGEAAEAEKARQALIAAGYTDAEIKDSVHPSTLKSFVKERLEAGDKIPLETFGVFEFRIAKITPPKAPKKG